MHILWMFPEYIKLLGFKFSQTLLTSFLSLFFFVVFVCIYNCIKRKNEKNFFVWVIDMLIEWINDFFSSVANKLPSFVKVFVLFLFVYILWNNLFGLFLDMFSTVVPFLHHNLRPVNTDVLFNAMLAVFWVVWSIIYWFKVNGFHFIEKYIPYKWFWLAWSFPKFIWFASIFKILLWLFIRIFDWLLALFIWLLEFIWEITKILSLSLRLFWNIFAWVVLLTLVVYATISMFKIPLLAPLLVFLMELLVSFVQAFVFSLLVLIYFKMAEESH